MIKEVSSTKILFTYLIIKLHMLMLNKNVCKGENCDAVMEFERAKRTGA